MTNYSNPIDVEGMNAEESFNYHLNLDFKPNENGEDFDISACKNNLESLDSNDHKMDFTNHEHDFASPMFKIPNSENKQLDSTPTSNSKSYIPKLNMKNYKKNFNSSTKKVNMTERTVNTDRMSELCQPKQTQVRKYILNQARDHGGEKGLHESMNIRQKNRNNLIKHFEDKFKKLTNEIVDRTQMQKANFINEVQYGIDEYSLRTEI